MLPLCQESCQKVRNASVGTCALPLGLADVGCEWGFGRLTSPSAAERAGMNFRTPPNATKSAGTSCGLLLRRRSMFKASPQARRPKEA